MLNFHLIEFERSFGTFSQLPESDRMEIAFTGKSNVGKSSLINKIFNRKKLAKVSAVPGKTSTINFFRLENLRFVDLPGYGYAKVAKSEKQRWAELIEGYFADDRDIGLVIQLLDMRHLPTKDDLQMIHFLIEREFPFILVLTKRDKLSKKQQAEQFEKIRQSVPYGDQIEMLAVSSETGEGIDALKEIITQVAQEEDLS